jgi:hypothetical protein
MKASWEEDYFKALIRLRLLLPVNPKTGTQKCDRCHIVAIRIETVTACSDARRDRLRRLEPLYRPARRPIRWMNV